MLVLDGAVTLKHVLRSPPLGAEGLPMSKVSGHATNRVEPVDRGGTTEATTTAISEYIMPLTSASGDPLKVKFRASHGRRGAQLHPQATCAIAKLCRRVLTE